MLRKTTETMCATYTKLNNGRWGVRVPGTPTAGQTVTVETRDGKTKTEIIERVLWTGADQWHGHQTMSLCAVVQRAYAGGHRERNDGMVRCRHCRGLTPDGDDWCTVCGRAIYE